MGKNWLDMYEKGQEDDLMEEISVGERRAKISAKNKMPSSRIDQKRVKTSYIAANKKAAKKQVVNTEEIEDLRGELCSRKRRNR